MHTVGSHEARAHFPRLLDRVAAGEEITITRHGVPVARLVQVKVDEKGEQITRYFIRNPEVLDDPHAHIMIQLMTAHDVLRSGLRWIKAVERQQTIAQSTECLVALLTVCGWIWEVRDVIRTGSNKSDSATEGPLIAKSMVEHDSRLAELWDLFEQEKACGRLKTIRRIRNKAIFHFCDKKRAKKTWAFVLRTGIEGYPLIETSDSGSFLDSRYPLAYVHLALAFVKDPTNLSCTGSQNPTGLETGFGDAKSMIEDSMLLLQTLIRAIREKIGLELVPEEQWGKR